MLELPANVLLATHPACSERRHHQPCRRSHERKLGDQTKDDADKEPREERSCGRSQTLLYNRTRRHSAIGYISPIEMELKAVYPCPLFRGKITLACRAGAEGEEEVRLSKIDVAEAHLVTAVRATFR